MTEKQNSNNEKNKEVTFVTDTDDCNEIIKQAKEIFAEKITLDKVPEGQKAIYSGLVVWRKGDCVYQEYDDGVFFQPERIWVTHLHDSKTNCYKPVKITAEEHDNNNTQI